MKGSSSKEHCIARTPKQDGTAFDLSDSMSSAASRAEALRAHGRCGVRRWTGARQLWLVASMQGWLVASMHLARGEHAVACRGERAQRSTVAGRAVRARSPNGPPFCLYKSDTQVLSTVCIPVNTCASEAHCRSVSAD